MFLRTYAKWIDGNQNDVEMARLENALTCPLTSSLPQINLNPRRAGP
jgi:integrase